jgi:O-antigen/teichoic acid export membrane protein
MKTAGQAVGRGMGLRKIGRDVSLTIGRQVLIIVVGLGSTVLIARLLGPTGNGEYALAMLLPTMLATFLNLGVAPANVYFVGRGEVTARTALRATIRLWVLLSAIGCIGAVAIIRFGHNAWFHGVPTPLLWLALVAFPVTMLRSLIASLLQALEDFHRYNKVMLAAPLATFVLSILAVWILRLGVIGALVAAVIGSASGLSAAYAGLKPRLESEDADVSAYCRRCLSYGWKAHLSNVLSFLNYRADVLLLNFFLNPAAAGIYMIAVKIAEQLWLFSGAVSTVILPRLSAMHREEEKRRFLTPLIARWLLALSACGALVLVAFGKPFIRVLFGTAYSSAAPALLWLLPGIVLGGSARVLANDIAARGRPDLNLAVALFVVVVNIVGNVFLIPRYGIVGASMATTLSYGLNSIVKLMIYSRLSETKWFASVVPGKDDWTMLRGAAHALVGGWRAA